MKVTSSIILAGLLTLMVQGAWAIERRGGSEVDYADIQKFHDESIAKFNKGDLEGSLADYLPRLRILNTKQAKITGREDMRASWNKNFGANQSKLISDIEELEVKGSGVGAWAYIVCRFAAVAIPKDKTKPPSPISDGRYIALLEKTAEGWKVLLDIDNGAPGAAPDLVAKLKKEIGQ